MKRVESKLDGTDFFGPRSASQPGELDSKALDVETQVQRLIEAATNKENLCQAYFGWCPFW